MYLVTSSLFPCFQLSLLTLTLAATTTPVTATTTTTTTTTQNFQSFFASPQSRVTMKCNYVSFFLINIQGTLNRGSVG